MRRLTIAVAGLALASATSLLGQQGPTKAESAPPFDAASIRPADMRARVHRFQFTIEPNRLTVQFYSVPDLLEEAYQLQDYQLVLPPGGKDKAFLRQPFDIQAVTAAPVTPDLMRARLARLLAERFHVVAHWETERVPMYRLEALPGGPKLKTSATGYAGANSPTGNRATCVFEFTGPTSMPQLADEITSWITSPKPVVDHTGVQGYFVMTLRFLRPGCVPTEAGPAADSPAVALRAVGLQLTPAHDPIRVLVIDSAGPVVPN